MQILRDIRQSSVTGATVLTIGNYDGVHRGHQALLDRVVAEAAAYGAGHPELVAQSGPVNAGLLTFDPHPLSVLRPDVPLQLLTTPQERLDLAARQGINLGILHPFDRETASLPPAAFMRLLVKNLGLVCLVTGPDFALGRDRTGDLAALTALGKELGYSVVTLSTLDWRGEPVRSRVIRELLGQGDVERAGRRLGRTYTVTGLVVAGDGRGRQIGIPTANVAYPSHKLLPADGVYVTRTWLDGEGPGVGSVTNIGVRPTVDGVHHKLETHLLDFPPGDVGGNAPGDEDGNLYGRTVTIEFLHRLRGEQRFASVDDLISQIRADIVAARRVLAAEST